MFYSPIVPFLIVEFLMERRLLWFFLVSWEITLLQSPCVIQTICVKPKRKRINKCRGERGNVRKIKVLTILRHQNRYSGQIGYDPGNLIEINTNNISSKSAFKNHFALVSSTSVPLVRMRNEPK